VKEQGRREQLDRPGALYRDLAGPPAQEAAEREIGEAMPEAV